MSGPARDEDGLILPRKVANPCLQSRGRQQLNREIRWNTDKGISVLNTKSELEKVFAKHKKASEQKRIKEVSQTEEPDEFKRMLAERAKRLEKSCVEGSEGGDTRLAGEAESELARVFSQLSSRQTDKRELQTV